MDSLQALPDKLDIPYSLTLIDTLKALTKGILKVRHPLRTKNPLNSTGYSKITAQDGII